MWEYLDGLQSVWYFEFNYNFLRITTKLLTGPSIVVRHLRLLTLAHYVQIINLHLRRRIERILRAIGNNFIAQASKAANSTRLLDSFLKLIGLMAIIFTIIVSNWFAGRGMGAIGMIFQGIMLWRRRVVATSDNVLASSSEIRHPLRCSVTT